MVEESSKLETDFIFLIQTHNKHLEHLLSNSVSNGGFHFESVRNFREVKKKQPKGTIITFIIGSDVSDPIQSAQRFHTYQKKANIVLLARSERNVKDLREAVKFSPFISADVSCLNESNKEKLKKELTQILQSSRQAQKYQTIIDETNSQLSVSPTSQQPAFNQQFISKLLDIAPIGIAIVNPQGSILGWNKEAASIFNKNEAQVLGASLSHHFERPDGDELEVYLDQCLKKDKPAQKAPLTLRRTFTGDNQQVLNITATPFTYSGGAQKALILAIKDVTERNLAQEQLQKVNETLEERVEERTASLLSYQDQLRSLASKLSKAEEKERHKLATELHDNLGQMLAVNKMKMELLSRNELPNQISSGIEEVKQGLDDALTYTRNLMSDLKPPPTLDKEDVRATIEWLANKMEKHDLTVRIEDDGQPKRASEEIRTTLLQSVRELLFNVIKHSGVRKALIRMNRLDGRLQIKVEDKGKGLAPNADTSTTTEKGGFGLFNIKERMDLLGGHMDIDSVPGEGTTVTLIAPLKVGEQVDKPTNVVEQEPSQYQQDKQKIDVMLVDDHQMVREGLKNIVDNEEDMIVIAEASDGKEAVELANEVAPDIIVMDVNMPRMNGIDATQEILSAMPDIRVIGLSLHDHQNVVDSMRDAGATAYISKNEAFETLGATIRSEAQAKREKE